MFTTYKKNDTICEILNDLVNINNDRSIAYRQAINEAKNANTEMVAILKDILLECEFNKQQLLDRLKATSGYLYQNALLPGKIYKAWTDLKINITKGFSKSLVALCEHNEDVMQHIYNTVAYYTDISQELRTLISEQQNVAKKTQYMIKTCRDSCHVFY